ncbi:UDP-N-acetylglucosamine-peptide N-acetylglucosaminyltransferase [Pseudoxanthomonas sp. Root65]|uniref:O-linked N-acetylglucosamine transferase, SPINDLY family protein n=1 Tax=Pseudoxanthomonas sp. Root65 TaxID=1736576 RepID=UPI000701182F|nr:tetratricopeptide repeat protein [Pseudoxanthomonas sp. Root65]KRA54949.1 UDP-N-acetylglucosamine-peptide N-acetylglucosaminyltransferase [Pseudoxanthomonas sp. Root65]
MAAEGPRDERAQLRQRVQRAPQDFIAWVMLSDAELDHGDADAGQRAAERALNLRPRHPEALARLGRSHWLSGRHVQAAQALSEAAAQAPQHPGIALWLGHALEDAGEAEAAAQAYEHAYRVVPNEPMFAAHLLNWRRKLCDWRELDALSAQVRRAVREGNGVVEPFAFLSEDASADEQLACARQRAQALASVIRPLPPAPRAPADTPLRLGFLSNGFGAHPTGLLTVAFFEALKAQDALAAHLFALSPDDGSPIRQRLQAATQLHDLSGQPHARIAQAIRDQRIDVLYDLRGWGGGGTPEVLAMRPAPVQVNWLAYPGTSGALWIDYVLADRFALPAALTPGFSEAVAWLPGAFQPSDTRRAIDTPPSREACGLPAVGVVYACFNNSYKMNPRSMTRMLHVLAGVEGSVLWLLSGPGLADDRLRAAAQAHGVDPARLVFMRKQPHADYLARYRHADLFLDTHPYNAHTTASDALWAGCPVLTCPGETFAARVAGSLNHHLGLDDMNVADDAAFVAAAIRLGHDAAARAELRTRLQNARVDAPLFDMPRFVEGFADIARRMADRQRAGLPPAPLD